MPKIKSILSILAGFFSPPVYKEFSGEAKFNCILDNHARITYGSIIDQMKKIVPDMMARKIPEANVQQAFILDSVIKFSKEITKPRLLCIGSFEDTAFATLKRLGFSVEEIDSVLNYDLHSFFLLPTTKRESFDIIFSTSVIEHVSDDETFMSEITTLLVHGGVCILTCDYNNAYKQGDRLPRTDLRFYTEHDFTKRLLPHAKGCSLVDTPEWDKCRPDFFYDDCEYSFATLTLRKD